MSDNPTGSITSGVCLSPGSHRTTCLDESRTKQEFVEETEINSLLQRWERTGKLEHLADGTPQYGDFSNVDDYCSARLQVAAAEESFLGLPAKLRSRFDNDPGKLLEFLEKPENVQEAVELGIITDPAAPAPEAVEAPPLAPEPAPGE